jgi:hypothetical protein
MGIASQFRRFRIFLNAKTLSSKLMLPNVNGG